MEIQRSKKITPAVNIAPLIDIVFLLLLFFILSSHFSAQPGIKINLPTSETKDFHKEDELIVYISQDNKVYLNEEEVSLDALTKLLRERISEGSNQQAIIKADEKINLGFAIEVIDAIKNAKVEAVVISTKLKGLKSK